MLLAHQQKEGLKGQSEDLFVFWKYLIRIGPTEFHPFQKVVL
jgi:hypothetical protein